MENGLLKEKHAIGLLLLQISCVAGIFCRGNWTEVKTKNYGGGGEERRQWERPPAINPLRFMKGPFQSCERRSWLTCDVTCFEVWRQPSHNVTETVAPNSLTLSLSFFLSLPSAYNIGKKFVYWNRALFFLALDIHILKYDQIYTEQLSWLKSQSFLPKQQVKQVYSCF